VLTTEAGAARLGGNAQALAPWQTVELPAPDGRVLRVTGTPARHGPPAGDRGPVIGFVLEWLEATGSAIYVSGDTVWYEAVQAVAERFPIRLAILFLGAARIAAVGSAQLTMTATEAVEAARAFDDAVLVPVHFEGWTHFSESAADVTRAFSDAGLEQRLRWLEPGRPARLTIG
jgi:L-ascorbate metabolism protein UlaG (beta-lactamase superfamily)